MTTYGYSAMNKVTSETEDVTDETTRSTVYTYDANDNLSVVERAPRMTQMVYDERDLLFTRKQVGANGDPTTTYTYDGNRNTVLVKNPRLKETTFTFDLFDRNTAATGPMGHWTERVHDEDGRVTETKSWEAAGDPGPTGDTLLAHHKDHYDERGRRWKEEDALLGESTTWVEREYGFDLRGLVTLVTDRRGKETAFTHDGAGRLLTTTDELGNVTENEYDDNGNVIAVEETEWNPVAENTATFRTEFTYDVLNRRITQKVIDTTNGSNFKLTQWKHAVLGLRKTIDPLENEVELILDGLGRTVEMREDLGSSQAVVTKWTYNAFDQVTQLLDDNEHATDYAYDYVGRLVSKTYEKPDPGQQDPPMVTYEHDANGNVTEITDQNGSVFAQAFDDLDRLTTREIDVGPGVGGGDASEAFAYDGLGRLLEAEDDDSTVQFTYDSLSRVLTEVQGGNPLGAEAKTTTYAWDEEGNRTEIGYPSGFEAHETRDDLGRISEIEDGSSVSVATFLNHGAGLRRAKTVFANSGYEALNYDGFRRPTSIAHKDSGNSQFAGFAYAWDKNDNPLTHESESRAARAPSLHQASPGSRLRSRRPSSGSLGMEKRSHRSGSGDVYSYDKVNRLTRVLTAVVDPEAELADPDTEEYVAKLQYNMDDVFNLTSYVVTPYGDSPVTTNYTTDALNQYTDIGAAELTYTAAGSLEDDGTRTYTYDAHQHLIAVHEGETLIASYAYDALGLGRRTSKTVSGTTTRYVYAGQQSVEEYEDGDLARLFVFGDRIDQVVMMEAPDYGDVDDDENTSEVFRFCFHGQLLGSVTHVTGPGGSVVEQYEYDPYGKPTIQDAGGDPLGASAIRNPYLYTGRQLDEETGLYYYRARMYSAEMRRFLQRDPLEYASVPNAVQYSLDRPSSVIDPTGLQEVVAPPGPLTGVSAEEVIKAAQAAANAGVKAQRREPISYTELAIQLARLATAVSEYRKGTATCTSARGPKLCHCRCWYTKYRPKMYDGIGSVRDASGAVVEWEPSPHQEGDRQSPARAGGREPESSFVLEPWRCLRTESCRRKCDKKCKQEIRRMNMIAGLASNGGLQTTKFEFKRVTAYCR